MRTLTGEGVPNIVQPSPEYPYGKFKNKTSANANDGTELSERVLGDMYQGMLNTITRTGATPNNQPETALSSQFADAVELLKPVGVAVVGSDDGSTFTVLASAVRDPAITFAAGIVGNPTASALFLSANFQIQRDGSLDETHRYFVTASSAYKFSTEPGFVKIPRIFLAHSPYFNNMAISLSGISNLYFLFFEAVSPSEAKEHARAVLTIYDAGPVS